MAYRNEQIAQYIADQGLTGNYEAIARAASQFDISAEQMGEVLGFRPEQVYEYASNIGVPLQASNQTIEAVVTDAYINQYGRAPTDAELEGGVQFLGGGGTVAGGTRNLSQSLEGYNYDVQDITAAFRQVYGRNPTQEEFVATASGLGLDRVNRDVLQFDNYQDALVNETLQNNLRANPNNPDAAYQATIRQALNQGVTVNQLARATGFGVDQIQSYAANTGLGELATYDALRAANPFRTSATVAALESDPYGGRFATVNPYTDQGINLSQTRAGDFIQYTSPVTQQPLTVRFEGGRLTVQSGDQVVQGENAAQAIGRSLAAGTLTQPEYDQLVQDLRGARSMTEVYDAFSRPQAQVVLDPTYGFQIGQGKTLDEAMANAAPIQNLVNQVNLGVMPGVSQIQQLARAQGVDYAYTPEMFGMQANAQGGFDFGATPRFSTYQTQNQIVTDQNRAQQLQNLVSQITQQYGQVYDLPTPLTGGYYSERGFEPSFTPMGTAPTFRSGVAGYVPQEVLPQGFQFGTQQVVAPSPVFTPGEFDMGQFSREVQNAVAAQMNTNQIIGYTQSGEPIFAPAATNTGGGS